jgi:hypothetical protein
MYCSRIKRAVDKYCRGIAERRVIFGDRSGTAMIRKQAPVGVHNPSQDQTPGGLT